MRIIAGKNRGTKLYTLDGDDITRPTLDRVKESLFNIIMQYLEGSNVLDLFAGSGALGLEALSRGANEVTFCDNSIKAINVIKNNIEKTRQEEKARVLYKDFVKAILNLKDENIKGLYYIGSSTHPGNGVSVIIDGSKLVADEICKL